MSGLFKENPTGCAQVSQIKLVHRSAIPATSTVKVPATSSPTCVLHRKPSTVASAPLSSRLRSDDGDRARTSSATVRTRRGTSVVSSVRVSGEEALIKYAEKLTEWEKTEILDFRSARHSHIDQFTFFLLLFFWFFLFFH